MNLPSFNYDDLYRVREAIEKGWDFTQAYGIDFERLCLELLDAAMEDETELGQKIVDCFPADDILEPALTDLEALVNALEDIEGDKVQVCIDKAQALIDKLESIQTDISEAADKAQDILEDAQ